MKLQELFEAAVGADLKLKAIGGTYSELDFKRVADAIKTHCSDSLNMLKEQGSTIYKGMKHNFDNIAMVDTNLTTRKSQNTYNYYTMILDNHPEMKDFPKRSKSLICSTSLRTAESYASEYGLYLVVPFNGSKIAACPQKDIWLTNISMFDSKYTKSIEIFNDYYSDFNLKDDDNMKSFKEFDKRLKISGANDQMVVKFYETFDLEKNPDREKYKNNFLKYVLEAYSPSKTGFENFTTKNFDAATLENREVWVQGKVYLIPEYEVNSIKKYLFD